MNLRECDIEYLYSRRISQKTIDALKIGYCDNRIIIPYWKNGYICSWIGRNVSGDGAKYYKQPNNSFSEGVPWGMHTLSRGNDDLVIAEGAFDALSFDQEGFSVLATMGGHFSKQQLPMIRDICRRFKNVKICFDNDAAGASFSVNIAKYLFISKITFQILLVPDPYKDVSEYYADGGCLVELAEEDGLLFLAREIADQNEFKKFCYQAARFLDRPDLSRLFAAAGKAGAFSAEWLKEVQRIAFLPPAEDVIAKAVTQKHKLRYLANVGFYEYSRGTWNFKNDEEIQAYVAEEMGHNRTGTKLTSVAKLLKAETITTEQFDKKPLFNFVNGTLELDTLRFRDHDPADLLSMQVSYPYDAAAKCPRWKNFIHQVCNEDPKRISLLQEIAGYILFTTCELEKIFVLTGDGSNGKSIFLNTLAEVFGEQNKSAVTLNGLMADFQRINLMKSLFNISTEIKGNMAGAEEYLKQIASGETISACYKGKNFIDFAPRCKMIFATNRQLKSSDTSNGLARRMCIVNFECSFVENPDKADPNQYKRDVDLKNKLSAELPGIFNWAVEGYAMLKAMKEFTETDDTEQNLEAFREASNPLITFLKENPVRNRISYTDYYEEYKSWCIQSGHQQMSRTSFTRGVKKILPKEVECIDTRINGVKFKGYRRI